MIDETKEIWVPPTTLARPTRILEMAMSERFLSTLCTEYVSGVRPILSREGRVTYNEYVVEALIRREYSEILIRWDHLPGEWIG